MTDGCRECDFYPWHADPLVARLCRDCRRSGPSEAARYCLAYSLDGRSLRPFMHFSGPECLETAPAILSENRLAGGVLAWDELSRVYRTVHWMDVND